MEHLFGEKFNTPANAPLRLRAILN